MVFETLRKERTLALKNRDSIAKEILNVALGDIETTAARNNRDATDEECFQVLKRLVKANEETLTHSTDEDQKATLRKEIEVLSRFLPKTLGAEELVALLEPVAEALRAAGNDGAATGTAMKHLKAAGIAADGKLVSEAVKRVRGMRLVGLVRKEARMAKAPTAVVANRRRDIDPRTPT